MTDLTLKIRLEVQTTWSLVTKQILNEVNVNVTNEAALYS